MCMIDGAEQCDVWKVTEPRARVHHLCGECRRSISPGEIYERVGSLYDGHWATYVTCRHCSRAGEWLDIVCGGWLRHGLHEELAEHLDEYPGWWIRMAVSGVSNQWKTRDGRRWNMLGKPDPLKLGVPGITMAARH